MLAIGFIYGAFGSHLCYLIAERQLRVAKTHTFWLLVIGILFTTKIYVLKGGHII